MLNQAYDADEVLTEGTKSFIDYHVTPARSGHQRRRAARE
jgi:hypothetical protein